MRIVHISTYCTGGAAKAAIRINHALSQAGEDSKMLVLYKTIEDDLMFDFRDEFPALQNIELKIRNKLKVIYDKAINSGAEELFSSYHSVWNVQDHSLVREADVINIHWVPGFLDFEKFFQNNSKKMIFTLHDFFPFSGGFHYPNESFNSEKWKKSIKENIELLKNAYKNTEIKFVGPSQYIIDEAKKSDLSKTISYSVIKNPIDISVFKRNQKSESRTKMGFSESDKVLLYIGENFKYKRKGFENFKLIIPEFISKGYKIIICGDTSKEFEGNKNIFQTGYIHSDTELAKVYNAADVLLFTSQNDNLPNTISESLCCGTPVAAFNCGGVKEMITENENGCLIEAGNADSFIKKTESLLKSNINREQISKTAHQIYSPELAAQKYLELYSK